LIHMRVCEKEDVYIAALPHEPYLVHTHSHTHTYLLHTTSNRHSHILTTHMQHTHSDILTHTHTCSHRLVDEEQVCVFVPRQIVSEAHSGGSFVVFRQTERSHFLEQACVVGVDHVVYCSGVFIYDLTALHYAALHYTIPHLTTLYYTMPHYTTLCHTMSHLTTLYYTMSHYTPLPCTDHRRWRSTQAPR
jgi:hypothetical protein